MRRCLAALSEQTYPAERHEIVVVDNASSEDLRPVVATFPGVRFEREQVPGSYAARNQGIAASKGQILAFTDSDCLPDPGWIEAGVHALAERPGCGAVGGRIEMIARDPGRITAFDLHDLVWGMPQRVYVERFGLAATANLFAHRWVFDRVGPFDASFKSCGDCEWSFRREAAGIELVYANHARVRHPTRSSLREFVRRRRRITGGFHQLEPILARSYPTKAFEIPRAFRHSLPPDPAQPGAPTARDAARQARLRHGRADPIQCQRRRNLAPTARRRAAPALRLGARACAVELLLLLFVVGLTAIGWRVVQRPISGAATYWVAGWLAAGAGGILGVVRDAFPWLSLLGYPLGSLFPTLLLAGALVFAARPVPPGCCRWRSSTGSHARARRGGPAGDRADHGAHARAEPGARGGLDRPSRDPAPGHRLSQRLLAPSIAVLAVARRDRMSPGCMREPDVSAGPARDVGGGGAAVLRHPDPRRMGARAPRARARAR